METVTKLDMMQQNAVTRAKREANINALKRDLQEAQELLEVIPYHATPQAREEWNTVRQHIEDLNAIIDDEERAIMELDRPCDAEMSRVFKALGI